MYIYIYTHKTNKWELKTGSNDIFWCVNIAIQREFAVSVQKSGFMVETL